MIKLTLNAKVKMCAGQFSAEVNPDTAADILLLADRHSLAQLKKVRIKKFMKLKTVVTILSFLSNFKPKKDHHISEKLSLSSEGNITICQ